MFRGIKVKKPVGGGGIGAWQVNLRYDHLALNDDGIVGGPQNGSMASLIWNPIDYVRFLLHYARLQYSDAVLPAGYDRPHCFPHLRPPSPVALPSVRSGPLVARTV